MTDPVNISLINVAAGIFSLLLITMLSKHKLPLLQKAISAQSLHMATAIIIAIAAYSICSTIALIIGELFGIV